MPELPEVETIRRGLERHLVGRRLAGAEVRETRLRRPLDAGRLRAVASGRRVEAVRRRAKYLVVDLEGGDHLLVHLGMTGQFFIALPGRPPIPHEHVVFPLDDGRTLRFADARRFGLLEPVEAGGLEAHPLLRGLGPEPLDGGLDPRSLREATRLLRKPIKNFLTDARSVAGVGNIYACEALFRAGVHPALPVRRIDETRWRRIVSALERVLREAVRRGGTTLQDFVNAEGEAGYFQMRLRVYDRAGKPCQACRAPVRRIVQAGRSTFFCPDCQPRRAPGRGLRRMSETSSHGGAPMSDASTKRLRTIPVLLAIGSAAALAASLPAAEKESAPAGRGQTIELDAGGERVKGYLALPPSGPVRGGVVVAHEWWGLNDQIRGVADRLAAAGYAALVPDLYRGEAATEPERAHELLRGLKEDRASAILRSAASWLGANGETTGKKIAAIGFCMGGRLALLAALDGREVAGAVVFYGQPVLEKERLGSLSGPVLGLFGGDDRGIPVGDVRAFEAAARALGKKVETRLYMGAGHAFFNETRPSYNADAAADAWKRTLAFLEKTLAK